MRGLSLGLGLSAYSASGGPARADITFVGASANTGGSGDVTPVLPAHEADDIALAHQTSPGTEGQPTGPAGWAVIDSFVSDNSASDDARATWYWRRLTSSETNPTFLDAGNHQVVNISVFRGCVTEESPIEAFQTSVQPTNTADFTVTGLTTLTDKAMVITGISEGEDSDLDTATVTNGDLESLTRAYHNETPSGHDSGHAAYYGIKATAGAVGDTSVTQVFGERSANIMIALTAAEI